MSCSIGNVNALLIRDSLDFCVYFVIPFVTLYYNAYRLRPLLSYYPIMKGLVQIVFVVTFLPNSLVVFLGNMTMVESLWIDIVFTVTLIVNNSFFLLVTTMHAYFKRHTRHMLFRFFCFPCYLIKRLNEVEREVVADERSFFSENNIVCIRKDEKQLNKTLMSSDNLLLLFY